MDKITLTLSEQTGSPLGRLLLAESRQGAWMFAFGISRVDFIGLLGRRKVAGAHAWHDAPNPKLAQVAAYLSGLTRSLKIPLDLSGLTDFQVSVYQAVCAVPYGQTATYGEIAAAIGRPNAARAVGVANGANPLPLIVPCHRLVGVDGSLRGYGGRGGVQTKRWLLDLEDSHD